MHLTTSPSAETGVVLCVGVTVQFLDTYELESVLGGGHLPSGEHHQDLFVVIRADVVQNPGHTAIELQQVAAQMGNGLSLAIQPDIILADED